MNSLKFKDRLFNFFLCPKNTDDTFIPRSWKKFSFFSWELFLCETDVVSIYEPHPAITYAFIGNLFNIDSTNYQNSEGHYIGFEFNAQNQSVKIFRNPNSHIAVYYHQSSQGLFFWGDFQWGRQNLPLSWKIDENSIEELFKTGLISQGRTLYKNIYQFRFKSFALVEAHNLRFFTEKDIFVNSSLLESTKDLFDFIIFRIQTWILNSNYKSFALSGGADSRLIFTALAGLKKNITTPVHTRLHPLLTEETDADFALAKEISELLNLTHLTQRSATMPTAYLSQELPAAPPIFSSLYGGEYLGGEVLRLISTPNSFSSRIRQIAETFTCDFYSGSWFPMYAHHNLTLTPFWDSYLVEIFLQLPDEVVINYRLYNDLLYHIPEALKKIPLQSSVTDHFPQWLKPGSPMTDPKSVLMDSFSLQQRTFDFIPDKLDRCNPHFETRLRTLQNLLNSLEEMN